MSMNIRVLIIIFLSLCFSGCTDKSPSLELDGDISTIKKYIEYSETFASSGQPTKEELQLLVNDGTQRIIYIALNDSHGALAEENEIVKTLGMEYIHIPVDFKNPTLKDFEQFVAIMQKEPQQKTLLHCQVNMRASIFSFLYRSIFLDVPVAEAKQGIDAIWEPNEDWFKFIQTVANHYELDINCPDCDWGANEFLDIN